MEKRPRSPRPFGFAVLREDLIDRPIRAGTELAFVSAKRIPEKRDKEQVQAA
jgi:hypothetical protein